MNNFLKTAYTAGAQQALVDFGVEKTALSPASVKALLGRVAGNKAVRTGALWGGRGLGLGATGLVGADLYGRLMDRIEDEDLNDAPMANISWKHLDPGVLRQHIADVIGQDAKSRYLDNQPEYDSALDRFEEALIGGETP